MTEDKEDGTQYLVEIHEEIVHQLVVTAKTAEEARDKAKQLLDEEDPAKLASNADLNYSIESEGYTGTWSTQPWYERYPLRRNFPTVH